METRIERLGLSSHISSWLAWMLLLAPPALAVTAVDVPSEVTLIRSVTIFDDENEQLLEGTVAQINASNDTR